MPESDRAWAASFVRNLADYLVQSGHPDPEEQLSIVAGLIGNKNQRAGWIEDARYRQEEKL